MFEGKLQTGQTVEYLRNLSAEELVAIRARLYDLDMEDGLGEHMFDAAMRLLFEANSKLAFDYGKLCAVHENPKVRLDAYWALIPIHAEYPEGDEALYALLDDRDPEVVGRMSTRLIEDLDDTPRPLPVIMELTERVLKAQGRLRS